MYSINLSKPRDFNYRRHKESVKVKRRVNLWGQQYYWMKRTGRPCSCGICKKPRYNRRLNAVEECQL